MEKMTAAEAEMEQMTAEVGEGSTMNLSEQVGGDGMDTKRCRENAQGDVSLDDDEPRQLSKKRRRRRRHFPEDEIADMLNYRKSAVLPVPRGPRPMGISRNIGTPNWGDQPSPEARRLVDISLRGYHDERARRVSKDNDSFAWTTFCFGGGLHINSFVDGAIVVHLNFKGKIKAQSPDSAMRNDGPFLFFAELKREHGQTDFSLVSCENLGVYSSTYMPMLRGCMACDKDPHRIVLMHGWSNFSVGSTVEFLGQGSK